MGRRHRNRICTIIYELTQACNHATTTFLVHTTVEESIGVVAYSPSIGLTLVRGCFKVESYNTVRVVYYCLSKLYTVITNI